MTGRAQRAEQQLFAWRLGDHHYVVQLDPFFTKPRRAWQVDEALASLVRLAADGEPGNGVWSAVAELFGDQMHADSASFAGQNPRTLYSQDREALALTHAAVHQLQPWLVYLEVNQVCNLKCDFCYVELLPNVLGERDVLHRAAQRISEAGALQVSITGGEPSLYPGLVDLAVACARGGQAVTVRTNLLRLPAGVERLAREQRIVLHTSYHHADAQAFDGIVGKQGAHRAITDNIRRLRELGVRVCCNVVLRDNNVDALDDMVAQLTGLDVPYTLSDHIFPYTGERGAVAAEPLAHKVSAEHTRRLLAENRIRRSRGLCTAAQSKVWLSAKGDVYPCELFREQPIGNYLTHSLREILDRPDNGAWREENVFTSEPAGCLACSVRGKCPRCPAMIHMEKGTTHDKHELTCATTIGVHGQPELATAENGRA